MQVRDVMTSGVECIAPDMSLHDAAERMKTMDVGFLPICQNDRLTGTITDRDIVIRAVAEGHDPKKTRAQDIMSKDVFYCFEDESVEDCADYMREKDVKRLLILNRNKRLVGVVSIGDLSKVNGAQEVVGDTLKDISEAA
jgi:CBS domain-containing protein